MKRLPLSATGLVPILVLTVVFGQKACSQLTPRGLGMGLAYTAMARGVHAADWNPANLGLPDNPPFSLSVFSVSAGVGNNSFSINTYNDYAVDAYWDPEEVEALLDQVPDNGLGVDALAELRVLSFSAGRLAFTLTGRAGGSVMIDRTLLEIPFEGTKVGETYRFNDMDATSLAVGNVKLSYGTPLRVSFSDTFAVGGSFHMDVGGGYGRIDTSRLNLEIGTFGFNIDGRYAGLMAPLGRGWGFDFGAAAKINRKWTVSAGLINLIGSIRWNKDVKQFGGWVAGDSVGVLDFTEDKKDEEDGDDEGISAVQDTSWERDAKGFSKKAPAEMHVGCLYQEGTYSLSADWVQGFSNLGWVTTRPRLAVGTEWRKVRWLPLRMGVVMGGRIGFGTSFGFGIRPGKFVLDVGVLNRGFILPGSSKGVFLGVEMGVGL
jgi:hypothetical protein